MNPPARTETAASAADTAGPDAANRLATHLMRLEHLALYAFAFVLPLLEAPKNLLWLTYAALWLANRFRAGHFGGRWRAWDTLIAAWIASGYLVAAFAGIRNQEWVGANDILRYGSMLWMLTRAGYAPQVLARLAACIFAGTVVTLAWGALGVLQAKRHMLGLRSVGHVNHSAIYLAIVFGAALMWLRGVWHEAGAGRRALGLALCVLFGAALIVMESRAAAGAAFAATLVVLAVYALRARRGLHKVLIGATVLLALLLALKPEVIEKNEARLSQDLFLSHRDAIWRAGLEAWREYPLFGVGMKNFGRISYDKLEAWAGKRGEPFDRRSVALSSHAHSLYVNTLAERGALGLGVLLAVLAAWFWSLARALPGAAAPPLVWAYWGGAAYAWLIAVIVGFANTTLHSEHALVSMLLLGGWLSLARRPQTLHAPHPSPAVRA